MVQVGTGGKVTEVSAGNGPKKTAMVATIVFQTTIAVGNNATLTLATDVSWSKPGNRTPPGNFAVGDTLDYTASNNNEAMLLDVQKVFGPRKYEVQRTA